MARAEGNKQTELTPNIWKIIQPNADHDDEIQLWHNIEWKDILRGAITHKILKTAEEITGNLINSKGSSYNSSTQILENQMESMEVQM